MGYITPKNLGALFLVGIMLFSIGINQSYAQTNNVNVLNPKYDFSTSEEIAGNCLSAHVLTKTATSISGTLGEINLIADCFEGDTRTWQAHLLNAVGDDIILQSTVPDTTSNIDDFHTISFAGLEADTEYRIVFSLTGSYLNTDVDPEVYVPDTSVYRIATVTTLDSAIQAPVAPNFTVKAISGQTITIPFSEHVSDPEGDYGDLDITFSLRDSTLYSHFVFTGASTTTIPSGTISALANSVMIENSFAADYDIDTLIDYTASNTVNTLFTSGVITINYVDLVGNVMANQYTSTLDDLFSTKVIFEISPDDVATTLLADTQIASFALDDITFSAIGTGDNAGTLTVTDPDDTSNTILTYTPMPGFAGTETFDYTVSYQDNSDTSQFLFVVPTPVCNTRMIVEVDFGSLGADETSDESAIDIENTGNIGNKIMIKGEKWIATDDTNKVTMNADVTKYSTTSGVDYATKTGLSETGAPVVDKLGDESVDVYLQLLIQLLDPIFRGETTQDMTIGSDCST